MECSKKVQQEKAERFREYDKNVRRIRDKQYNDFYHSSEWIKLVEVCKIRYKHLDIYSYYVLGKIEYGNICHHIVEIRDDFDKRLDLENLIYLSNVNHAFVHAVYNKSDRDKVAMQDNLRELIKRWKKDFG